MLPVRALLARDLSNQNTGRLGQVTLRDGLCDLGVLTSLKASMSDSILEYLKTGTPTQTHGLLHMMRIAAETVSHRGHFRDDQCVVAREILGGGDF